MSPRKFDRFMCHVEAGRNHKLLRLTIPERWAYMHGVVALAAKSPDRGALLIIEGEPVTPQDVAVQATVSVAVARSAMAKARRFGMLYTEDGVERVHDFEELNPPPKRDETNAERQARHRERRRNARDNGEGNANSNAVTPVTSRARNADEVEVEVEVQPPSEVALDARPEVVALSHRLADSISRRDPSADVAPDGKGWLDALRLLLDSDKRTAKQVEYVIDWLAAGASKDALFWQGVVLSAPKLRAKFTQLVAVIQREGAAVKPVSRNGDLERWLQRTGEAA